MNNLKAVFGVDFIVAIESILMSITPVSRRITCGEIITRTESYESDAMTRRVALDKCLVLFPKLYVRKGRDGGIIHKDEQSSENLKAGKAISAALAALECAGVTLSAADVQAAILAAKAARKHAA